MHDKEKPRISQDRQKFTFHGHAYPTRPPNSAPALHGDA